jgi:hypothetical protein
MLENKLLMGLCGPKRYKYVLYVRNENLEYGGRSTEMSINPLENKVHKNDVQIASFQHFDNN